MTESKAVERRSRIDSEAVKALLLINGGMAAGLTAMLPKIIEAHYIPIRFGRSMIVGVCFAALGLMCVVIHSRLRRKCSLEYSKPLEKQKPPYKIGFLARLQQVEGESRVCTNCIIFFWSSLACFCLGAFVVAFGAWTITTTGIDKAADAAQSNLTIASTLNPTKLPTSPAGPSNSAVGVASTSAGVAPGARDAGKDKDREGEGTEYFPPVFGHRFKITDGLIVLFTGLLFGATVGLWRTTAGLVKSADKNAEKQLRAYISVTPTTIISNTPFTVEFRIENHGQTPAHDERLEYSGIEIWEHPLPTNFSFPQNTPTYSSRRTLYRDSPGKFRMSLTNVPFTSTEVAEVTDEGSQRRIYLYGSRRYRDAFGRDHATLFCRSLRPNAALGAALRGQPFTKKELIFEVSEQHNSGT